MAEVQRQVSTGIDWLSYTKAVQPDEQKTPIEFFNSIHELFIPDPSTTHKPVHKIFLQSEQQKGRAPYSNSIQFTSLARLFYNNKLNHASMELSGITCMKARELDVVSELLEFAMPRITRLDLAVDVECDVKPIEIITKGISARFKTLSQLTSDSGDTVYIGSRKSEKFMRIYRYNEPHPRNQLLRFEFVFKREYAVAIASALISSGYNYAAIAEQCRKQYDIEHPIYPRSSDSVDVEMQYDQRTAGKTLQWLIGVCAPAFQKLCNQGLIDDPENFVQTHFLKGL